MGLIEIYKKGDISIPRIIGFSFLLIMILSFLGIGGYSVSKSNNYDVITEDKNVYLNEPIQYAKDVYITVVGINVLGEESTEGVVNYTLNLNVEIESKHKQHHIFSAKLADKNFSLKSVNLKSKSKMAVFIEALAKETLNAAVGIAIDGGINVIEETLNYIGNYVEGSIENAENKSDFKPIKTTSKINKFNPCKLKEKKIIELSFPISYEYLESDNPIVLAIDSVAHIEKHIFLTKRPNL